MKYMLHLRGRPQDVPTIESRHQLLIDELAALECERCRLNPQNLTAMDTTNVLPVVECKLTRGFRSQMKGEVRYYNREYAEDVGRCDDFLDLEFDPNDFDYDYIVRTVFPAAIRGFTPYLGLIAHMDEWTDRKGFVERRSEIRQFDLVNFFDRTLCRRAFGVTPIQLGRLLKSSTCEITSDRSGILIHITEGIVGYREARRLGTALLQEIPSKG